MKYCDDYFEMFKDYIESSGNKELITDYTNALNDENFVCKLDDTCSGDRDKFIQQVLFKHIRIVVEKDTQLDVGEEKTKLKKLGREIIFTLSDVYDFQYDYSNDDFFDEYMDKLVVNDVYEVGQLADAISDETGYLVQTVYYHLKFV